MIGIIISAHGSFASGMLSSLALIMGKESLSFCEAIDFDESISFIELKQKILAKYQSLDRKCDHVVVLTDIKSGTPFNVSTEIALSVDNLSVLYGINLPLLFQLLFERKNKSNNYTEMLADVLQTAQENMGMVDLKIKDNLNNLECNEEL